MKRILGGRLNIDWKIAVITVVSTLLIIADYYYSPTSRNYLDSILLFVIIPLGITIFVFKEKPADYGFKLGDWKTGLLLTFLGLLLMAPIIWFLGTRNSGMQGYYNYSQEGLIWKKALELFGWEYIFRGWILFGYARKYGPDALWIQAVPFAVAHLGKPEVETLSTIFGGFAFGWVAWRTGSFVYSFLIHWFIAIFIVIVSVIGVG
ncbi:MAG: CPBP family intramembrane metalloprotease [Anaerolineales bacterium]|nr:CPBP family intramembrane metalloprotease [Anaerolineales bacterium]